MKLEKIKLTELADAELNEREMCRILGGGIPGCCQCGCHYANSGGSSMSSNGGANNSGGLTSDPGVLPCCGDGGDTGGRYTNFVWRNRSMLGQHEG